MARLTKAEIEMNKMVVLKETPQRDFDPKETYKLLMYQPMIVGCWGANAFGFVPDKALFFKVQGYLHNGFVLITLGWDDTYNITLLDKNWVFVKERKMIYFDVLVDVIDRLVETK